jgi:hypothetical protein
MAKYNPKVNLWFILLLKSIFKRPSWKKFLEDIMLFVVKCFFPLRMIKYVWLQRWAFQLCPRVTFPSKKVFIDEVFTYIGEQDLDIICATYISKMLDIHMHFQPLDVKRGPQCFCGGCETSFHQLGVKTHQYWVV